MQDTSRQLAALELLASSSDVPPASMLYQTVSGRTTLVVSGWVIQQHSCGRKWISKDCWGRYWVTLRRSHMLRFGAEPWHTVEALRSMKNYCFFLFFRTTPKVPLPLSSQKSALAVLRHARLFALQWDQGVQTAKALLKTSSTCMDEEYENMK